MKLYLKVMGVVHVILAFLKVPAAKTAQKMAPGTGTRAPQMDRHLKNNSQHKHTGKQ